MKNFVLGIVVTLLLIIIAGGIFLLGKNYSQPKFENQIGPTDNKLSVTVSPQKIDIEINNKQSPTPSQEETSDFVNPSATIDAIKTLIPEKNYSELSKYMTDKVNVLLYASECCGFITKNATVNQMDYLNDAANWNFADNNPEAKKLEQKAPEYFKDAIIGTSQNGYAVGFNLNDKYLIEKIVITGNYQLMIQ